MKNKATKGRRTRKGRDPQHTPSSPRAPSAPGAKVKLEVTSAVDPKWSWHYRTLSALRAHLLQDSRRKLHDASEAIEPHSMHLADSATDEFDHDLALTLLAREENALNEVNDAITRILEGRYGVCGASGVKIPARRLRAVPWCRYSREVEESLERSGDVTTIKIPGPVSLRGVAPEIPGTGTLPREGMEGEPEELEEPESTKVVEEKSTPTTAEIEPVQ